MNNLICASSGFLLIFREEATAENGVLIIIAQFTPAELFSPLFIYLCTIAT